MTALKKYTRLEAAALWRPCEGAQRRDVIVALGNATLTFKDGNDRTLAHWSLGAVVRANPDQRPAIFHPDGDPGETLEIASDEDEMICAIEKLRRAVERTRPHRGRLRGLITLGLLGVFGIVAYSVLPSAIIDHALRVVPDVKRMEIGEDLLDALTPVTGPPCRAPSARPVLERLAERLGTGQFQTSEIAIVRSGVATSVHLPGGMILLSRKLVEDFESPDAAAGYVLAEEVRRAAYDPLQRMLDHVGIGATLRLLTSGSMPAQATDRYAKALLTAPPAPVDPGDLLAHFVAAQVPATPYAYAVDLSGETTLSLIEADLMHHEQARPVLSDNDWVRLQAICEG